MVFRYPSGNEINAGDVRRNQFTTETPRHRKFKIEALLSASVPLWLISSHVHSPIAKSQQMRQNRGSLSRDQNA
jgi:hypothetical protein